MTAQESGKGVGARLHRKEDRRYLRGRGEFIGDIAMVGMVDVAFVRQARAGSCMSRNLIEIFSGAGGFSFPG